MRWRALPVVLLALLVVAAAIVLYADDDEGDAPQADPVPDLLAAFERSRTETFVVEQRFSRTAPDGRALEYDRRLVQRPPDDRFLVGGGNGEGRLDGHVLRCSTGPDGTSRCDEGPAARPYEEEVEAEVEALRALVTGDPPPYEVAAGEPGCFELTITTPVPSPPYGDAATFCFDAETGAPTRIEVHRPEAVDLVEAIEVRPEVTAEDLRPGDLGDLPA